MKNPVKLFVLLLLWVIGYLLLWPAGSRAEYVSITDLQKEAEAGWHETYQAHGRTIVVDIPVNVPKVGSFPVLKVEKEPAVDSALFPDVTISTNEANHLYLSQDSPDRQPLKKGDSWFRETFTLKPGEIDWNKQLTLDNPITAGEAVTVFDKMFTRLHGGSWKENFSLESLWVTSRLYAYNRKTKEFGEPMNTWGGYYFMFSQTLCGIPVLNGGRGYPSPNQDEIEPSPAASAHALVFNANDFTMSMDMVRIMDMPYTDVPLLSFDAVKAEFEKWIESGRLREVTNLSLGYRFYADPETKGVYLAYPFWMLDGILYRNAEEEPAPPPEEGYDTRPTGTLYLPAQAGPVVPLLYEATSSWQMPELIRWEDIR